MHAFLHANILLLRKLFFIFEDDFAARVLIINMVVK